MATPTSKDKIVSFLSSEQTEATSYDVLEALGISASQTDFLLKELTEDGTLVREKKSTNGGRPVYHYKLAVSPNTTVATTGTKTLEIAEAAVVVEEPVGPKTIYLVRKNDQPEREWRSVRQYDFARALQPFDKFHSRTFAMFGNTVVSVFVSDASIEAIAEKIQTVLPELTFAIATTLTEAQELILAYSPTLSAVPYNFPNWATSYFYYYQTRIEQARSEQAHGQPTAVITPVQAPPTPTVASRTIHGIMNDLADNGTLETEEMKLALQTLAQDWLDNN